MREGPLAGQRVRVETQLVIGRVDADVTIDDPLVSRRHAVIRPSGDALEVEDLGSLNGTWVNGGRLEGRRALHNGDLVQIGGASFEVEGQPIEPELGVAALGSERPCRSRRSSRRRRTSSGS